MRATGQALSINHGADLGFAIWGVDSGFEGKLSPGEVRKFEQTVTQVWNVGAKVILRGGRHNDWSQLDLV